MASTPPSAQENFYEHVNKAWLDDPANSIPDEYSSWGGFTKLHDEGLKKQIALVKELNGKSGATVEEKKISAIWEASAGIFSNWASGGGDYEPIVAELKALDEFLQPDGKSAETDEEYINRVAAYFHYTQINGFRNVFDYDKGSDLKCVNNVVLDFSTCGLSLPSREYYTDENFEEKRKLFVEHLQNVVKLVGESSNVSIDDTFVANVVSFENELASTMMKREQSREYDKYFDNTTLEKLVSNLNDIKSLPAKEDNYPEAERNFKLSSDELKLAGAFLEKTYELFDFRAILKSNYEKNFVNAGISGGPDPHHITTFDGDSIRRVLVLVTKRENYAKYRSYLQYKLMSSLHKFCTKSLDDEFFDFYSRKLNGQAEQKPEEKRSINTVNGYAGEMMGKVFVAHFFPPECKEDVSTMIKETLDIMEDSIQENDWLTPETKVKASEKLKKFNVKIGYPDVWKDYSEFDVEEGDSLYVIYKKAKKWNLKVNFIEKINSVLDRNEWHMTPQTVNAYFSPTQNEIVFPAAILQPPFYHKSNETIDFDIVPEEEIATDPSKLKLAESTNFGGIGAVIAHEITHGYDDQGRKFDGDGNMNDWWTEADTDLFKSKSEIMGNQTTSYLFIDKEDNQKEYKMNAQLTMGENLADLGGLSLSLKALKKRLAKVGIENGPDFTANLRIAFKAWANVWKLSIKKDSRINRLTTDPHAPTDFRGNLVNNMQEFYDCFNVQEGDKMYLPPDARLRMW